MLRSPANQRRLREARLLTSPARFSPTRLHASFTSESMVPARGPPVDPTCSPSSLAQRTPVHILEGPRQSTPPVWRSSLGLSNNPTRLLTCLNSASGCLLVEVGLPTLHSLGNDEAWLPLPLQWSHPTAREGHGAPYLSVVTSHKSEGLAYSNSLLIYTPPWLPRRGIDRREVKIKRIDLKEAKIKAGSSFLWLNKRIQASTSCLPSCPIDSSLSNSLDC